MCGIAGIYDVNKSKAFGRVSLSRELLLSIERRGRHATGYAFVNPDNSTEVCKADLPAHDFVEVAPMFTDGLDFAPRAILLHTRYATQGSPSINVNNHPIHSKISGLTLIHNGWLTNEKEILRKYRLTKDGDVDSETILRLIEHFLAQGKKIITAIKLAMNELQGVFACALISEKYPDTLWLWRSANPLQTYRDETSGAFIFASTRDLLSEALIRAGFRGGNLVEFPDYKVAVLTPKDGAIAARFESLKVRPRPVRHGSLQHKLQLSVKKARAKQKREELPESVFFDCPTCGRKIESIGGRIGFCTKCRRYRDVPEPHQLDIPGMSERERTLSEAIGESARETNGALGSLGTAAAWEAWKEQGRKINELEIAAALRQSQKAAKKNQLQ